MPSSSSSLGFLLRLPLASSRLLRQDRHRLLRFFSISPSPIPKSSPRFSTKPHARGRTTKMDFLEAIKQLASKLPSRFILSSDPTVDACMEVFDIRIQRFDGKRYSRIYGTVASSHEFLYKRPITNPESVHLGFSPLLLTGPEEYPVTIIEGSQVDIDIKDADTDEEIIKGFFFWDLELGYDRFLQKEVRGTTGSAMISYAVFEEAVSGTIEIKLLKGGGSVFGVVAASNTFMSERQSVLFHKEKEQSVNVMPKEVLPLSRSIVALPENSDLNVRVELWNCDGEIGNATVTFPRQHRTGERPSYRIISRQIRVTVTWTTDAT